MRTVIVIYPPQNDVVPAVSRPCGRQGVPSLRQKIGRLTRAASIPQHFRSVCLLSTRRMLPHLHGHEILLSHGLQLFSFL